MMRKAFQDIAKHKEMTVARYVEQTAVVSALAVLVIVVVRAGKDARVWDRPWTKGEMAGYSFVFFVCFFVGTILYDLYKARHANPNDLNP